MTIKKPVASKKTSYYFSVSGNDKNDGSAEHPLQTISRLNAIHLNAGDTILLKGGEKFEGNIVLKVNGVTGRPVTLTSYGNGNAVINAGNGTAIGVYQSSYVNLVNITCRGSGRKNGNTKSGLDISDCGDILISNIDVSGFQKSGLQLYNCKNTSVDKVYAHDNGAAGIGVEGDYKNKLGTRSIYITNCSAINNPGDPTNLTNHSGNGIVVGHCTNLVIDHCMATNNGWDMPRIGNGPVGIWCYEADSVTIQHCISYKNKTSKGGEDGGGYDLDGGTTNSIIQYCLSYQNQGSGFGIFQYAGASNWHDNVIRFCISENDGNVSSAHAAAYVWNGSGDATQFKNLLFYNNTIYNYTGAAVNYQADSKHVNFKFYNNIFIASDELLKGDYMNDTFLCNDWWSLKNGFNVNGEHDFKDWCHANNKEQSNGKTVGLNILPAFEKAPDTSFNDIGEINNFNSYKIVGSSPMIQVGIDLPALFNIDIGNKDFNDKPINKNYLGACTH